MALADAAHLNGKTLPNAMNAHGHKIVHHIVARGDRVEHLRHVLDFLLRGHLAIAKVGHVLVLVHSDPCRCIWMVMARLLRHGNDWGCILTPCGPIVFPLGVSGALGRQMSKQYAMMRRLLRSPLFPLCRTTLIFTERRILRNQRIYVDY